MQSIDYVRFLFERCNNSFYVQLYCECILNMAKTKFRFSIFGHSHRVWGGVSEATVGSQDPLHFLMGILFVQEGSNGTRFDHD